MERKGVGVAGLLLVGLLVMGTGCGGGSKKDESSTEGKITGTTVSSSSSDTVDDSTSSDASGTASGAISDFLSSDCQSAVAAYSSIFTSALGGASGVSEADKQKLEDEVATLKGKVPAELEDDIATVSNAYQAYFDALGNLDLSDLANSAGGSQIEEASKQLDSPEFTAAQTNIENFFKENCPSMAGSLG